MEMPSSKKGWLYFRTSSNRSFRPASDSGVYWYRLAIGEEGDEKLNENRKPKLGGLRWFSYDQNSDGESTIVGLDSHIYTLGGMEKDGVCYRASSRVYRCCVDDEDDDYFVWQQRASMLVPRQSPQAVVVAGKIFVVGGYYVKEYGDSEKWVEVFDPAEETWEFLPPPVLLDGRRISLYDILHPSNDRSHVSMVVFGCDQILFSSGRCSYFYNVRDHSLRESPYRLRYSNLFDHEAPAGVEYCLDWKNGSVYGQPMCEHDPSTVTHICRDSFFEGTSFLPDKHGHQPIHRAVVASFSGHGGVFDGQLQAHVLLLEYGDMRDGSRTNTVYYRHLVYSKTGKLSKRGAALLRLHIKNTSMFLLDSHDFLIDGVIMGRKDDGSEHRALEPENHEVRSLTLWEKGTKSSRKRKMHESHCSSSVSESVPIQCYLGGNIKYEDPIGYVGGKTELITVDRLTTTYVSLVRLLLELLDTEHGGQSRSMNLIFKCPLMDLVGSGFTPIALTNDEQVRFMLDIQIKHPDTVVVELFVELK